jgi:hypothetical protein
MAEKFLKWGFWQSRRCFVGKILPDFKETPGRLALGARKNAAGKPVDFAVRVDLRPCFGQKLAPNDERVEPG